MKKPMQALMTSSLEKSERKNSKLDVQEEFMKAFY